MADCRYSMQRGFGKRELLASMSMLPRPVHGAIICTDVEGFGNPSRTGPDQLAVRTGLYRALKIAFAGAGVLWQDFISRTAATGS
jgi:hypothetical protein